MTIVLDAINGICWSIVYITAIILGFKNRTWCIPGLAICQNLAWEFLVLISRITKESYDIGFAIQLIWLILDTGVLMTWFLYDNAGRFSLSKKLLLLVSVPTIILLPAYFLGQWELTAFMINAIMSIAFIVRYRQDNTIWSSHIIAIAKLIGTLSATVLYGVLLQDLPILWIGGLCMIFDCYYCALLINNFRMEENNCVKGIKD